MGKLARKAWPELSQHDLTDFVRELFLTGLKNHAIRGNLLVRRVRDIEEMLETVSIMENSVMKYPMQLGAAQASPNNSIERNKQNTSNANQNVRFDNPIVSNAETRYYNNNSSKNQQPSFSTSVLGTSRNSEKRQTFDNIVCYNCNQRGHYKTSCPLPQYSRQNDSRNSSYQLPYNDGTELSYSFNTPNSTRTSTPHHHSDLFPSPTNTNSLNKPNNSSLTNITQNEVLGANNLSSLNNNTQVNYLEAISSKRINGICKLNDVLVVFQIDTGADISAINHKTFELIGAKKIKNSATAIKLANGTAAQSFKTLIKVQLADHFCIREVLVVPDLAKEFLLGQDILSICPTTKDLYNKLKIEVSKISSSSISTRDSIEFFLDNCVENEQVSIMQLSFASEETLDNEVLMQAAECIKEECNAISATSLKDLTPTNTICHKIKVLNEMPIRQKIRKIPITKKE